MYRNEDRRQYTGLGAVGKLRAVRAKLVPQRAYWMTGTQNGERRSFEAVAAELTGMARRARSGEGEGEWEKETRLTAHCPSPKADFCLALNEKFGPEVALIAKMAAAFPVPRENQTHTNTQSHTTMAPELRRSARRTGANAPDAAPPRKPPAKSKAKAKKAVVPAVDADEPAAPPQKPKPTTTKTDKIVKAAVAIADPDIDTPSAKPAISNMAPRSRSRPRSHSADPAVKPTELKAAVAIADPDIDTPSAKPAIGNMAPRSRSRPRSHSADPAAKPTEQAAPPRRQRKMSRDEGKRDIFDLSARARRHSHPEHVDQQDEVDQEDEEEQLDEMDAQYILDSDGANSYLPPSSAPNSPSDRNFSSPARSPSPPRSPSPARSLGEGGSRLLRRRPNPPSPTGPVLPSEVANMVLDSDNSESDDDYEKAQLAKEREAARYAKRKSPGDDVVEDYKGDGAYIDVTSKEEVVGKGKGKAKEKPTKPPTKSSTATAKGKGKQKEQPRKPPVQPSTTIVDPVAHKGKSKSRQKHRAKAKAVDDGDSDDGGHTSSDDDDLATAGFSSKIPGALSQTQKEQLDALQAQQEAEVAGLAESFGKNTNVLEQYLGRRSHMVKEKGGWNLWQGYYVTPDVEGGGHIKPEGMSSKDFNRESRAAYKKAAKLSDEDLKNPDLVKAALPWLFKWHEQTVAAKAVKPIVDQKNSIDNRPGGGGGPTDGRRRNGLCDRSQRTRQLRLWSGPRFERVKTQYKLVLQRSLKDQEHIFGTAQIELNAIAMGDNMPPVVLKSAGTSEYPHDADRRQFGELVRGIVCTCTFTRYRNRLLDERNSQSLCAEHEMTAANALGWKMKWGPQWADFAWENQLRVVNWYKKLEDEGHVLGIKVVVGKSAQRRSARTCYPGLVKKYARREDEDEDEDEDDDNDSDNDASPVLEVVLWTTEEKAMPLALQCNIPLVVSGNGRELVQVKHSQKWKKTSAAAETKAVAKAEKKWRKSLTSRKKSARSPSRSPRPFPVHGQSHSPAPRSRAWSRSPRRRESALPSLSRVAFRPQDELQSQRHADDPSRAPLPVAAHPRVTEDRRSHQHAGNPVHAPLHAAARLHVTESRPDAGDPPRVHLHVAARPLTAALDCAADCGMNAQLLGWLKIEGNHVDQQKNPRTQEPSPPPRRKPSPPLQEPSRSWKRKRDFAGSAIDNEDRGEGPSSMNASYELSFGRRRLQNRTWKKFERWSTRCSWRGRPGDTPTKSRLQLSGGYSSINSDASGLLGGVWLKRGRLVVDTMQCMKVRLRPLHDARLVRGHFVDVQDGLYSIKNNLQVSYEGPVEDLEIMLDNAAQALRTTAGRPTKLLDMKLGAMVASDASEPGAVDFEVELDDSL
ncbi:hypothetical protein C8J57DRAFT_1254363 [Mycena rebaudengoi]|nr:hypothetical protein C8J57DRAFT_1254363 [Mycena rebaudengoi]